MYGSRATRNWENVFRQSARPLDKTKDERCENAIKSVRNAISKSKTMGTIDFNSRVD